MADDSHIKRLLERQARLWDVGRRLAERGGEEARRGMVHLAEGPWLTISRQLGSGGAEIARLLSKELDWPIYDREILSTIARETHTKEKIISRLDEHAVGHLNDLLRNLIVPDDMGQAGFLAEMSRVVWTLGRGGKAIVLGRGANWILDPRFGLRVRVIAPIETRIARVAALEGLDDDGAAGRVRAHDSEQEAFIRQAFGRRIEDPCGYDLILNGSSLDPNAAAATVLTALREKVEACPAGNRST